MCSSMDRVGIVGAGTAGLAAAAVRWAVPRIVFEPAREHGRPTCELLRLDVNFRPRELVPNG